MNVLSILCATLLSSQIIASNVSESDLGQDNLRSRWIEASESEKGYSDFKSEHYLADIAEDHWIRFYKKATSPRDAELSLDIGVSAFQARQAFALSPWNLKLCASAFLNYLRNLIQRPMDATSELPALTDLFFPPLVISLILLLSLHLWCWAPALCKNFPRWFASRSPVVLLTLLATFLFWSIHTGYWTFLCLILTVLSVVYSRDRLTVLVAAGCFALYLNVKPVVTFIVYSISLFSAHEALEKGRTRLEYSPQSLERLSNLEKALWANYNGDTRASGYWLSVADPSKEKSIVEVNFSSDSLQVNQLLEQYEKLRSSYPDDQTILFNLSQLNIRAQQLVQADKLRSNLPADFYSSSTLRASSMNRLLIPPPTRDLVASVRDAIVSTWKVYSADSGFSPFNLLLFLKSLFILLAPWSILALGHFARSKASGLCVYTGETTDSPDALASSLYQTVSQKRETTHPTLRQKLDLLVRRNNQMQYRQLKQWRWFFPGASSLILDQSLFAAYVKTLIPMFFLWNAFSTSLRNSILEWCHAAPSSSLGASSFSMGFLVLFAVTYIFFLSENISRARS
jgi:hypothetical protein